MSDDQFEKVTPVNEPLSAGATYDSSVSTPAADAAPAQPTPEVNSAVPAQPAPEVNSAAPAQPAPEVNSAAPAQPAFPVNNTAPVNPAPQFNPAVQAAQERAAFKNAQIQPSYNAGYHKPNDAQRAGYHQPNEAQQAYRAQQQNGGGYGQPNNGYGQQNGGYAQQNAGYNQQNGGYQSGGQPAQKPSEGLSIAGMICGIASLLFLCLGIFSILLGIAAVICSVIAMKKKQNRGMYLTGLITGGLGLILGIVSVLLLTAIIVNMFRNGGGLIQQIEQWLENNMNNGSYSQYQGNAFSMPGNFLNLLPGLFR